MNLNCLRGIWRHPRNALVLAALLALNHFLEYRGVFEPFSLATYDMVQNLALQRAQPDHQGLVTIFTLPEERNAADSEARIARLIQVIACGQPALIGVDWRTGKWNAQTLLGLQSDPAARTPIVWAREADEANRLTTVAGEVVLPPLWSTGIAATALAWDRAIRTHRRFLPAGDSFAWVVARTYCRSGSSGAPGCPEIQRCSGDPHAHCESEGLLDFKGDSARVARFPAEAALAAAEKPGPVRCDALPNSGVNPAIQGRIVLVGGDSPDDLHPTPIGLQLGVQLIGHAIQSDLAEAKLRPVSHLVLFLLHLASALIVICLNHRLTPFQALGFDVVGLPVLCMGLSLIAFQSIDHWFNFAPLIGGVIIHQLWEQAELLDHARRAGLGTGASAR